MFQMKNKLKTEEVIVFITLFLVGTLYFVYGTEYNQTATELHSLRRAVSAQQKITKIAQERQSSIKKVVDIISRYNKDMPDSLKYDIANEIYSMSQKYNNLNVDLIAATITHESAMTWDPEVTSNVGAMGLMQVMPSTGAFLAIEEGVEWSSPEDVLYDPISNIRLGCRYLNELIGMYDKDGGLAAYNGGPKRAEMWIVGNRDYNILWEETQKYVPAVMQLYDRYRSEEVL